MPALFQEVSQQSEFGCQLGSLSQEASDSLRLAKAGVGKKPQNQSGHTELNLPKLELHSCS